MDAPVEKRQFAWQPLTARGVAAFAGASLGRLLLVQFLVALIAAAAAVWLLLSAFFPTITKAMAQLPPEGQIRAGSLDWRAPEPVRLAEGRFLALAVDLKHAGSTRSPAHFQVEFGQTDFNIFSLFGFVQSPYPRGWRIAFNRVELEPWWGAWQPALLGLVAVLVVAGSLVCWAGLATVYCLPAWLGGFFANRNLGLGGSWRLAGSAQLAGTLCLAAAMIGYGLGWLDLLQFTLAGALDLVLGWVYLFAGLRALPRHPDAATVKGNPFAPQSTDGKE